MKRINQVNESKKLIMTAFLDLLEKKDYDEITLTEIADNAKLTRMTLYRHYKSKQEIIKVVFTDHLEDVMKEVAKTSNPSFYDVMCLVFKSIKKNRFIKASKNSDELHRIYLEVLRNYNFDFKKTVPDLDDFTRNYIIGGINKITSNWLDNNCNTPIEKLAMRVSNLTTLILNEAQKKRGV